MDLFSFWAAVDCIFNSKKLCWCLLIFVVSVHWWNYENCRCRMIKLWRWFWVHDINSVCEDLSLSPPSSRLCKTFEIIQNLMWFILVCCTWHTGVYARRNSFICGGGSVFSSRTNSNDHEKAILLGFGDDSVYLLAFFLNNMYLLAFFTAANSIMCFLKKCYKY